MRRRDCSSVRGRARTCRSRCRARGGTDVGGLANGPKFFRDDPITRDPETEDAAACGQPTLSELYDFAENSFLGAGERADRARRQHQHASTRCPTRAGSRTALGRESLDDRSAGQRARHRAPARRARWTIVSGKIEGVAPGFTIRDATGQLYFIKFDPPSNPEMASGAEVISTKFFHAFGYHVPENYLATVRRESLVIGEGALIEDDNGRRRQMDRARSRRAAEARRAQRATAATASSPARRSRASRSGRSATTARGPTTRTTSSRTSTGASCAGCSSSAPG